MTRSPALRICSLDSALARRQTQIFAEGLAEKLPHCSAHIQTVASPLKEEDKAEESFLAASPAEMAHLTDMLRRGAADAVVAAAADLVLPLAEDLQIACVPPRATPFDALLNRQGLIMDDLAAGCRIGVLTLRAKTQMQKLWPDLSFEIIRGGVDRALATHLRQSEIEGLVLPAAITEHLGIQGIVTEIFSPEFLLPGPTQGLLAVLGRADDDKLARLLQPLHSRPSAVELKAEQAFQMRLVKDQELPVGVLAKVRGREISVTCTTGAGASRLRGDGYIDEAEMVGQNLADHVLQSVDSFLELLEADFPEGLPDEDYDPDEATDDDFLDDYADDLLDLEAEDGNDPDQP